MIAANQLGLVGLTLTSPSAASEVAARHPNGAG